MSPLENLRALGPGDPPPEAAKDRVFAALQLSLQAAAAAALTAKVGATASAAAGRHGAQAVLGHVASAKLAALGMGLLLVGGVAGAALYGGLRPPVVKVVYVDRPVLVAATTAPTAAPSAVAAPSLASSSSKGAAHVFKPTPASDSDASELARERALLDLSRKSAAGGDAVSALATAERHRAEFPNGRLAEEREALAIRALSVLGRSAEARERAATFHATYPNSFLAGIVDSAASVP